jgi:thymidylate synthase (FAD)
MTEDLLLGPVAILDHGWVSLIRTSPDPRVEGFGSLDTSIATAARTSYLSESKGVESDAKLINYLWKHKHTSPFEMTEWTYLIEAPLIVWWQWLRHRTAQYMSLNSQSGRYTEFSVSPYIPAQFYKQSVSNHQGGDEPLDSVSNELVRQQVKEHFDHSMDLYSELLTVYDISKEQARYVLPGFNMYYRMQVKMDGLSLLNFLTLRLEKHAQLEIRKYAQVIFDLSSPLAPLMFKAWQEGIANWEDYGAD